MPKKIAKRVIFLVIFLGIIFDVIFGETKQIVVALVATALKALISVSKTSIGVSGG